MNNVRPRTGLSGEGLFRELFMGRRERFYPEKLGPPLAFFEW